MKLADRWKKRLLFNVWLTVHPNVTVVIYQLDAQFFIIIIIIIIIIITYNTFTISLYMFRAPCRGI
jgi:hypothetical protein